MVRAPGAFGESEAERIEVGVAPGHPKLTRVARDGDPAAGIAMAVVTDASPRATLTLALVAEARMSEAGVRVSKRVDRESFFLTTYASEKALGNFFAEAQKALKAPITKQELDRAETRIHALGPLPSEPAELADIDRCVGKLAMQNDQATTLVEVERARQAAFVDGRVSFAIVGPAATGKAAERALVQTPDWPKGALPDASPSPAKKVQVGRALGVPRGAVRVSVALPVADPRIGAGAAERIGKSISPLRAKLDRLRVPFALDEVSGVAQPHGGCISVTATSRPTDNQGEVGGLAGLAGSLIEAELERAVGEAADPTVASRQVLRATDPVEAATIAAWWALATPSAGGPSPTISAALLDPEAVDASLGDARSAIGRAAPQASPTVTLRGRAELGQGELWMAVADSCATQEEAPHQWGTAALVALAASMETPEVDGVRVEALVDARGVGVFAHAAPRKGESPTELADRVSAAAATAFLGNPVTSDDLLEAQSLGRTTVERSWGHETLGLGPFAEAASPEHPTLIEPLGSFAQVARSDPERAARRWRRFGSSGITVGVLANAGDPQPAEAQKTIERWLVGGNAPTACSQTTPLPRPGRSEVHGSGTAHSAWLFFGIPADRDPLAKVARVVLDGQSQASQSRSALAAIPGATSHAWLANGTLVIAVQAPDELIDTAERAMRDLMGRFARGDIDERLLRDATREAESADQRELADPRNRLRRLVFGEPLEPLEVDGQNLAPRFKAFGAKSFTESRWVVVVAHPS